MLPIAYARARVNAEGEGKCGTDVRGGARKADGRQQRIQAPSVYRMAVVRDRVGRVRDLGLSLLGAEGDEIMAMAENIGEPRTIEEDEGCESLLLQEPLSRRPVWSKN
jgi:hypothetical protein